MARFILTEEIRQERCKAALAAVTAAAVAGTRCPEQMLVDSKSLAALAHAGSIKIEIGGRNWRVVHLLRGPHRGKHTALPEGQDGAWRPYLVIDRNGTRRLGRLVSPRHKGATPSLPTINLPDVPAA